MMRDGALERLTDADLRFSPGGWNISLGELFRSLADTQAEYITSLETLVFEPTGSQVPDTAVDLTSLRAHFAQLDQQMLSKLRALTEDDLLQQVRRPNQVMRTVGDQFQIYVEAAMIFMGKLVIYFLAMEKELPPSIAFYIA